MATEYKVISANSTPDFQRELLANTTTGWKPILLTSAAAGTPSGTGLVIVAILEKGA
ncbi:MAG TPA: hypothetical protein VH350_16030 [Candidatus Sulfotelmatobacter sp.]|jgi:hypothetical protein|nr:hypothetical protein [Candidatus Sulfotelmatobacter sp.]